MAEPNPYESPAAVIARHHGDAWIRRPIGVWIAVIWSAVFSGVLPTVGIALLYFGAAEGWRTRGWSYLVLGTALGMGIVIASIGSFLGNSTARYALVAFVAVDYGLSVFIALAALGSGGRGDPAILIPRIVCLIVTAGVIAGYLVLSKNANAFFAHRQPQA
jgi:hypothetical protein